MKRQFLMAIIVALMAVVVSQGIGSPSESRDIDFDRLAAMNRPDLTQALYKLIDDRNNLSAEINGILRSKIPDQRKIPAIQVAGIYRLERCSTDLARIIDLRDAQYTPNPDGPSIWSTYPASSALFGIGDRAIEDVMQDLATSDNALVRQLSVETIKAILGPGPSKAALQREIDGEMYEKNDAAVARLKAATPLFDLPKMTP